MPPVTFGTTLYRFPHIGGGVAKIVEFVQRAEAMGLERVRLVDHVVGIVAEKHGGIAQTPYTDKSEIREVFTLMAYLAAKTSTIRFVTAVLGLPQRQTVLVAKQAAEVDILSGGRLTLGVAVGYNPLEFEALGADFKTRGRRFEEQIEVLRLLWTERDASFEGEWHKFQDVSLSPQPIQRPIPLFFGMGRAIAPIPPDVVLRRVGRMADGWMPIFKPTPEGWEALGKMRAAAEEAGRDPDRIEMDTAIAVGDKSVDTLRAEIDELRAFGAHHIAFNLPGDTVEAHLDALGRLGDMLPKLRG